MSATLVMMNQSYVFIFHRSKMQESSIKKKADVVEMAPQLCLDSLDNNSSSSVSHSQTPSTKIQTFNPLPVMPS